jgi:uncharacterized MAPEG superfamily protein
MSTELLYLTLSAGLTAILWVPYILERITGQGLMGAMGYPQNPVEPAAWAKRLQRAHANMVENLAPFAALVLIAHVLGVSSDLTVWGSTLFFWGRIVHAVVYALGVPVVRTLAFAVSWTGMLLIFVALVF